MEIEQLTTEKKEQIEQAIELIIEAKSLVEDALYGSTIVSHFEAYGKYGFDQLLGNGNPYDSDLYSLIEKL